MAESANILTKLQDLLVYLIPQLNRFPRDQKFVLGDRIETKLLDVQEDCLRAYYGRDKRGHLLEAHLQLEVARHLVRLAHAGVPANAPMTLRDLLGEARAPLILPAS